MFGHFGDRIGRKRVLVTLLLMGSTLRRTHPGATTIGAAAPIADPRAAQGRGRRRMGGRVAHRACSSGQARLYGMFTQLGYGTALILANLVFLVVYSMTPASSTAFLGLGVGASRSCRSAGLIVTGATESRRRVKETLGPLPRRRRTADSEVPDQGDAARTTSPEFLLAAGAAVSAFSLWQTRWARFFTDYANPRDPRPLAPTLALFGRGTRLDCARPDSSQPRPRSATSTDAGRRSRSATPWRCRGRWRCSG